MAIYRAQSVARDFQGKKKLQNSLFCALVMRPVAKWKGSNALHARIPALGTSRSQDLQRLVIEMKSWQRESSEAKLQKQINKPKKKAPNTDSRNGQEARLSSAPPSNTH